MRKSGRAEQLDILLMELELYEGFSMTSSET